MKFILSFILSLVFLMSLSQARADFQVPALTGPVVDQVGLLNRQDLSELEQLIRQYNEQGKAQLQVLIIESLGSETIETASIKVVDQWKLGSAKADNGVLFLVAPVEKKMRLEVGQGLEGVLTDAMSKRILDDTVKPLFRTGDFSSGVLVGVFEILRTVDKDFADQLEKTGPPQRNQKKKIPFWVVILFWLAIMILFSRRGSGVGAFAAGYGMGGLGRRGGPWGGGSGGGGGGWSGGGGGFSGGGASSGW